MLEVMKAKQLYIDSPISTNLKQNFKGICYIIIFLPHI
jgi:hypothetical protein